VLPKNSQIALQEIDARKVETGFDEQGFLQCISALQKIFTVQSTLFSRKRHFDGYQVRVQL